MFAFKEPLLDRPNNYSLSEIALKSGFKFRDIENRKLDWRTLGCVDVNKVIENQDYEFLEKITPKIIEAPMQSILGTAALDPAVSSLFRLSQMCLQYFSFCQQFMSHTLYDLRTAFNQLQRKYSNLKHNYKCLEEQHYKAQERIQTLLNENKSQPNSNRDEIITQHNVKPPTSLFPCDQCTKNFLSLDLLKSHQQRKHSVIEEKHELSDDNEKKDDYSGEKQSNEIAANNCELSQSSLAQVTPVECLEPHASQIKNNNNNNNNNNDTESNSNCKECAKKVNINSSSIAIQCEVNSLKAEPVEFEKNVQNDEPKENEKEKNCEEDDVNSQEPTKNLDNELVQNAYDTINELKKEIVNLKKSLEQKTPAEPQQKIVPEHVASVKDTDLVETNDKIGIIEQKFSAFETMYVESQHHFIESFRSLDERQKIYMDNIQETIKDIVEKSLGHLEIHANDNHVDENICETTTATKDSEPEKRSLDKTHVEVSTKLPTTSEDKRPAQSMPDASNERGGLEYVSSGNDSEADQTLEQTFRADVHLNEQSDSNNSVKQVKNNTKKKYSKKQITKEIAFGEFGQRLQQLGVDIESTSLPSPRLSEVNRDLTEEREEMKKAHKSFDSTRKKIKKDVDRIAKEKLQSGSSITSLSSMVYQSDDQITEEIKRAARPKSASVQQMRKRNAKKLMKKYVENDIDESDIMDKMKIAQKAISAHRECIQELLQTTAHSPSSLTKTKYPGNCNENTESMDTNHYNKMPNVTSRRVVFVNLDEDS